MESAEKLYKKCREARDEGRGSTNAICCQTDRDSYADIYTVTLTLTNTDIHTHSHTSCMYLSLWTLAPLAPKSNQIQLRAEKAQNSLRVWGKGQIEKKKRKKKQNFCSITRARFVPYVNLAAATTNNFAAHATRKKNRETETEAKANNKTKVAATAAATAGKKLHTNNNNNKSNSNSSSSSNGHRPNVLSDQPAAVAQALHSGRSSVKCIKCNCNNCYSLQLLLSL